MTRSLRRTDSPVHTARTRGGAARATVIVAGTLLVVAALGSAIAFSSAGAPAAATTSAGTNDWANASVQSFDITTIGTGALEAKVQKEFRNPLESESSVLEIAKEGTVVKIGEVLVKLNTEQVQKMLDQELLMHESAKAELIAAEQGYEIQQNENDSSIRKATLAVELADLDLKKWLQGEVKSRRQTLAQAIDEAQSEVKRLGEKVAQNDSLLAKGFLSRDEHQRNQIEFHKSKTQLAKAQLDSQVFEEFEFPKEMRTKESALEEARAELERTKRKNESQTASKTAERENKKKQLALREAAVAKLTQIIESATIKATTGGLVVYGTSLNRGWWGGDNGPMQVGKKVYPNELIIALPDTSDMVASIRVSESIAGKVRVGLAADVRVDALPGVAFTGKVDSIGVLAERSGWDDPNLREYSVKILLDKPFDEKIKPSMRCEATLKLDRADEVVSVPIQAVFAEGPVRYVITKRDGKVCRAVVRVDKRSDRFAAIGAGLNKGDPVMVRQPAPGEVPFTKWDEKQLAAAGLTLGPDGNVTAIATPSAAPKPEAKAAEAKPAEPAVISTPGG